ADDARLRASDALRAVVADLKKNDCEVVGCGLLLAAGRPLPGLGSILASHALIHTADGELFRDALAAASGSLRLPLTRVREREVRDQASAALRLSLGRLDDRLRILGRKLGPPWRQDEKLATLAAWLVLGPS